MEDYLAIKFWNIKLMKNLLGLNLWSIFSFSESAFQKIKLFHAKLLMNAPKWPTDPNLNIVMVIKKI